MIDTRVLDVDPDTGAVELFHFDDATGEVTLETQYDLEEIVEHAKAQFNSIDERANWKGDLHKVGYIPDYMWYEMRRIYPDKQDFKAAVKKFLNDSTFKDFRTRPGRV